MSTLKTTVIPEIEPTIFDLQRIANRMSIIVTANQGDYRPLITNFVKNYQRSDSKKLDVFVVDAIPREIFPTLYNEKKEPVKIHSGSYKQILDFISSNPNNEQRLVVILDTAFKSKTFESLKKLDYESLNTTIIVRMAQGYFDYNDLFDCDFLFLHVQMAQGYFDYNDLFDCDFLFLHVQIYLSRDKKKFTMNSSCVCFNEYDHKLDLSTIVKEDFIVFDFEKREQSLPKYGIVQYKSLVDLNNEPNENNNNNEKENDLLNTESQKEKLIQPTILKEENLLFSTILIVTKEECDIFPIIEKIVNVKGRDSTTIHFSQNDTTASLEKYGLIEFCHNQHKNIDALNKLIEMRRPGPKCTSHMIVLVPLWDNAKEGDNVEAFKKLLNTNLEEKKITLIFHSKSLRFAKRDPLSNILNFIILDKGEMMNSDTFSWWKISSICACFEEVKHKLDVSMNHPFYVANFTRVTKTVPEYHCIEKSPSLTLSETIATTTTIVEKKENNVNDAKESNELNNVKESKNDIQDLPFTISESAHVINSDVLLEITPQANNAFKIAVTMGDRKCSILVNPMKK